MAKPVNKEWVLNGQIDGTPTTDNFTVRETAYIDPKDGEYVIKTDFFSVDPYLRGQFRNPATFNKVINCYTVGTVIESKTDAVPVGTIVTGILPAQLYVTTAEVNIRRVNKDTLGELPLSAFVGALGMPGATAHGAIKNTKAGDVVFINASCGIVGSMLGQLAKAKGAKLVIGTAGGEAKCKLAVEKYGYDVCLNYKEYTQETDAEKSAAFGAAIKAILQKNNVEALDTYYDLVGSWMTDAIIGQELIKFQGKAAIIGGIDEYNTTAPLMGPRLLMKLVYRAVTIEGFIVFAYFGPNFPEYTAEFEREIIPAIKDKKLNLDETVVEGFENVSEAFVGLFKGANIGKMIVKP